MNVKGIMGAAACLVLPAAFAGPAGPGPLPLTAAELDQISAGGVAAITAQGVATSPILAITSTDTTALTTLTTTDPGFGGSAAAAGGGAIAIGIGSGSTTDTSVDPVVQVNPATPDDGTLTISMGNTMQVGFLEISTGAAVQVGIVGLGLFP